MRECVRAEELDSGLDGVRYRADGAFIAIGNNAEACDRWGDLRCHGRKHVGLDDPWRWVPSIFMPRWASRLTLRVTDVRVERVQEISGEDVLAEGVQMRHIEKWEEWLHRDDAAVVAFGELWDSINGKRPGCAWGDDPWVWAVTFERIDEKG